MPYKDKEKKKENGRKYYIDNKESIRIKGKQYRLDNKDKLKQRRKTYYINNVDILLDKHKKYYKKNKNTLNKKSKDRYYKENYYINNRNTILSRCKKYRNNNKDKVKKLREDNKEKYSIKKKVWYVTNRETLKIRSRNNQIKNLYSITPEQFEQMKLEQNNCCAIHGGEFNNSKDTHIDHIHNSTPIIVRGILCGNCNRAIGYCKDDIKIIKNLIAYIQFDFDNGKYKNNKCKEMKLKKKQMITEQDNKCFTCNTEFKNTYHCHMDHNHTTNRVRQILCKGCNSALGLFKEDISTMQYAVNYLINHNKEKMYA